MTVSVQSIIVTTFDAPIGTQTSGVDFSAA
jgi:hypothetical protein